MKTLYTHYKKTVSLALLTLILSLGNLHAQDPELFSHIWYLHSITENSTTSQAPQNPEMTIQATFGTTSLFSDMCCAGDINIEIDFDNNQALFTINNLTLGTDNCLDTDNNDFRDLYVNLFQSTLNNDFEYSITTNQNWGYTALTITNADGDIAQFYNTPYSINLAFEILFPYEGFWYLENMYIGGTSYSDFDITNEGVDEITIVFSPNGMFEANVCGQLVGSGTFVNIGPNGSLNGEFYINCEDVETDQTSCGELENIEIENLFFNFFIDNSDEVFNYDIAFVDFPNFCPEIVHLYIHAPNGDTLFFVDCREPLALNTFDTSSVSLYPNPTQDILYINVPDNLTITAVRLLDLQGRLLEHFDETLYEINISTYNTGVYFLEITTPQGKMFKKVLKE